MGKLGPHGTGKKRLGRHKTERKGTVTRKLGGSPQMGYTENDPADQDQVKAGKKSTNYATRADNEVQQQNGYGDYKH